MGRYVSTGAQVTSCTQYVASTCYQVSTHKYAYDANSCWQNRIILDSPGSYTFTVPSGVTCIRTIAVGGGGKSYVTCTGCCGTAGAGGGYSERWDTVSPGTQVSIVVGRQQQDTTISYTNASAVSRTLTAGGAIGPAPGTASGGDWNSRGGCAGINCNYCGGTVSHFCGSCIYQLATTCCGYCVVWAGVSAKTIDPGHSGNDCCLPRYSGGGSAGSWMWPCGGDGQSAQDHALTFTPGFGSTAGGGGGIGYIARSIVRSITCNCICMQGGYNGQVYGTCLRNSNNMTSAGGGGGTKWQCVAGCDCAYFVGQCQAGRLKNGPGGWGAPVNNEGKEYQYHWGWSEAPNGHGDSWFIDIPQGPSPMKYNWHDIHDMQGSGSSGRSIQPNASWPNPNWVSSRSDCHPDNAGEGAGTGGLVYTCCDACVIFANCCVSCADACGTVNWQLLCCLGTINKICCADRLESHLFPYIVSCAGTLGGAGGVGVCHAASKAGKGGGSGVNRSYILCVCYGGTYDLCNGTGPALAFPPSELDWRVSTAGTGMAIIYWKS